MHSDLPKVLHTLLGKPMISYVAAVLRDLGFGVTAPKPVYVVGYGSDLVEQEIGEVGTFAIQREQLGTGHAAAVGLQALPSAVRRILLIHGDEPLIEAETYRQMISRQECTQSPIVLLTGEVADTHALGRVVRTPEGRIEGLVQENELTPQQRSIREINFGAYVFDRSFIEATLPLLDKHAGGEYYLTDLVRFAVEAGKEVESVAVPYPDEQMGINDESQRERAEAFLGRLANRLSPVD